MDLVGGEYSKTEMKILLLLARMTISFNRATHPLSRRVIEEMTRVQGNAAAHAIRELVRVGLVQHIPGDPRWPSEIGLILIRPRPVCRIGQGTGELVRIRRSKLEITTCDLKLFRQIAAQNGLSKEELNDRNSTE